MSDPSDPNLWAEVAKRISESTGDRPPGGEPQPISGGCIHGAYRFGDSPSYFIKTNTASFADSFSAEADALRSIGETGTVTVPRPIAHGAIGTHAFLAIDWFELRPLSPAAGARLGSFLAGMHRQFSTDMTFGWHRHNNIGATPQPNNPSRTWADFFSEHRLGHQFRIAAEAGSRFDGDSVFLDRIHTILSAHSPPPSLLHGDLWGGNVAANPKGEPVIFDPATYFGDRETDLAFTKMFGGFGPDFYRAYESAWPLPEGSAERIEIYNLYHILNHHHLFGGGYRIRARDIMRRFL